MGPGLPGASLRWTGPAHHIPRPHSSDPRGKEETAQQGPSTLAKWDKEGAQAQGQSSAQHGAETQPRPNLDTRGTEAGTGAVCEAVMLSHVRRAAFLRSSSSSSSGVSEGREVTCGHHGHSTRHTEWSCVTGGTPQDAGALHTPSPDALGTPLVFSSSFPSGRPRGTSVTPEPHAVTHTK